jgi:hypothetical protein
MESDMAKNSMTFEQYLQEIFDLSEISEIPGVKTAIDALIKSMWEKYPEKCKEIGLTDGLKK